MMDTNRRLRYYASLRPWLRAITIPLVFVVIGALMYLSPRATHPEDRFLAILSMAFFGLGVVFILIGAVVDRREPVLTLTPAGIQIRYMRAGHQIVGWAELTALGISLGERWSKKSGPEHYLIALGRRGARVGVPAEEWAAEDWEEMREIDDLAGTEEIVEDPNTPPTLIMLPLNELFATRKAQRIERKCVALLAEIAETFAPEIDLYKITVEREIQALSAIEDDG
jgi:hypothetical protein